MQVWGFCVKAALLEIGNSRIKVHLVNDKDAMITMVIERL